MRILVIGDGGRESAICRALCTAKTSPEILIAPGNAGTARFGQNHAVAAKDVPGLVALAKAEKVDLVIPGGETSLVLGLADELEREGIACAGPRRAAAMLEGSKHFTRELAAAVGAPSPRFVTVTRAEELEEALRGWQAPPVVKADGLCAGKGVYLPETIVEVRTIARELLAGKLAEAGRTVVLEERLFGVEASLFYACDGARAVLLPHARDHKRLGDGDTGPNTGGMGAMSPNPDVDDATEATVRARIVEPVLNELASRNTPFVGFLYAGIMMTANGPVLLEFNVRLGDPEAQAILPRLVPGAFLRLCEDITRGTLGDAPVATDPSCTCAVVLAAAGYPDAPRKGDELTLDREPTDGSWWVDLAGVKPQGDKLVTSGGRVLAVVARAKDAAAARAKAYAALSGIKLAGVQYRKDIAEVRS